MSILPMAVFPTRSVFTRVNDFNPFSGYAIIRYENVQGAFSLTVLNTADVFKPPEVPGFEIVQLGFCWRAIIVIRSFDPLALDSFGRIKKRRRYGFYTTGYADLDSSLHYINFEKQLTGHYAGFVDDNGFASWVDVFPPPIPLITRFYDIGNVSFASNMSREFATLIKGELTASVIADIYMSAFYVWLTSPLSIGFGFIDV